VYSLFGSIGWRSFDSSMLRLAFLVSLAWAWQDQKQETKHMEPAVTRGEVAAREAEMKAIHVTDKGATRPASLVETHGTTSDSDDNSTATTIEQQWTYNAGDKDNKMRTTNHSSLVETDGEGSNTENTTASTYNADLKGPATEPGQWLIEGDKDKEALPSSLVEEQSKETVKNGKKDETAADDIDGKDVDDEMAGESMKINKALSDADEAASLKQKEALASNDEKRAEGELDSVEQRLAVAEEREGENKIKAEVMENEILNIKPSEECDKAKDPNCDAKTEEGEPANKFSFCTTLTGLLILYM